MKTILSNQWVSKRKPYWERLTHLTASADGKRIASLSRGELRELALLYRQVASDLSTVRQDRTATPLAVQLNHLLGRAHHIIYSSRKSNWRSVWLFLWDGYPRVFRAQIRYVFAALIILLTGTLIAVGFTLADPRFASPILGPGIIASIEQHRMWTESIVSVAPQAASGIMTNNISVAFSAFAGGMLLGCGSIYVLFFNGLMLGAVATACQKAGMSMQLWSFVVPHGSLELPAIIIAGAAGLRLGQGILFPGMYRWKDSVARGGAEAVRLVAGTVPMLFIAGCLEGFFSPSGAAGALKFAVGGALFLMLLLWLFRPLAATDTGAESAAG